MKGGSQAQVTKFITHLQAAIPRDRTTGVILHSAKGAYLRIYIFNSNQFV